MSSSPTSRNSPDSDSQSSGKDIQEVDKTTTGPDGGSSAAPGSKKRRRGSTRQGACVHCKSLKVRCEFTPGETRCQRCITGNHPCISRDRKKRKPAPTHEDLQARSKQQDEQLASLLRHFDQLKMENKVEAWVRRAEVTRPLHHDGTIARPVPVLTCHFYSALIGPLEIDVTPHSPDYMKLPIIMRSGILAPSEVLDLFNLFFERINPFFSLLDGELHCPQKLVWLNHFLFTVICALACRHYTQRPGLYDVLMDIVQDAAGEALVSGLKTVETVQAFLLLAVYPLPRKKWSDDRSWLFMGSAIRLAQELQLDKSPEELDEQDNFNRVRTWLNCFCVDGSLATLFGKPSMVKLDDYLVRIMVRSWYKLPGSAPYDIGLCAHADSLLLMAQYRRACKFKSFSQVDDEEPNLAAIAIEYDKKFTELYIHWNRELGDDPNVPLCPVIRYRFHNFSLSSAYLRLVVLSQGFQYSVQRGITRESYVFQKSFEVAQLALETVIEKLFPSSLLGWAMEANFVHMSFCAAFLLNFLRPKFLPLLDLRQCTTIVTLVQKLIKILSSDDVALDGKHSPAIYSRFLAHLLTKYYTPALQNDVRNSTPEILAQYQPNREQSPPYAYSWPDTPSVVATPGTKETDVASQNSDYDTSLGHVVRQEVGEAQMDFSLHHFVRSTMVPAATANEAYASVHYMGYYPTAQDPRQWCLQPGVDVGFYPSWSH